MLPIYSSEPPPAPAMLSEQHLSVLTDYVTFMENWRMMEIHVLYAIVVAMYVCVIMWGQGYISQGWMKYEWITLYGEHKSWLDELYTDVFFNMYILHDE